MTLVAGLDREALRRTLDAIGADGWLVFDFRGVNPVAARVLGRSGMGTRRLFVWLPREGEPVAIAHKIELHGLSGFPGRVVPYARWQELHAALRDTVGRRTAAMEIWPEDAVPYLDRVPFGVVGLLQSLGVRVVPSGDLVTRFAARWTADEERDHQAAAEHLARIARSALARAVTQAGQGLTECGLQAQVLESMRNAGLTVREPPIVAFGPNTADPHYEPMRGSDRTLGRDEVVLLDLWGGMGDTVFADQTWMGFSGTAPPRRVLEVWETVRAARDAALAFVEERCARGEEIRGFEVDRAARAVIERAGFGVWFVHRTGHSIDKELHGSGPHCDDYETRDERALLSGVGFSVEPGVYLPGEFGVRSEVNVHLGPAGPRVTPREIQQELIVTP
jgi:Xaa-Pro aminopeptidase